jgi:23S rRNA (adenine1618-N6)-methyltransferase
MHSRNRHRGRYDFPALVAVCPDLGSFVSVNAHGDASIDFSDAAAVKALNRALLQYFYEIEAWDIPDGYLCPPIPGRADYLHHAADLLAPANGGEVPTGDNIRVLDIGVGANAVYPLIGRHAYGWQFVGSDIDARALDNVRRILDRNPQLAAGLELRLQTSPRSFLRNIVEPGELFDLTVCNPPFHTSTDEAGAASTRKWQNLGKSSIKAKLNFGGQSNELLYSGGEEGFITGLIEESKRFSTQCLWFTSLVSKATTLPAVYRALRSVGAVKVRTVEMAQGQKKSRFVAWTFFSDTQHKAWRQRMRGNELE